MVEYRNIKFPDDMVEDIIKIIDENKELGYRSHSEFMIGAVREKIIKVKEYIVLKKNL